MTTVPLSRLVSCEISHPLTAITVYVNVFPDKTLVSGVFFGKGNSFRGRRPEKEMPADQQDFFKQLNVMISGFLDGKVKELSSLPLDLSGLSPFFRQTLLAARKIRWGTTRSYSALAAMIGNPRAVRAVASVMRNNPFPLIIPCHRVIKINGLIGGFMGNKSGKAIDLKRRLLLNEGIHIS